VFEPRRDDVPIDAETLKSQRDQLKGSLRELEADQRKLDTELKRLRQLEIRTKREIEALATLIEIQESSAQEGSDAST
jgi:predicted  nucleic acid-binding Zn-ribbon protein